MQGPLQGIVSVNLDSHRDAPTWITVMTLLNVLVSLMPQHSSRDSSNTRPKAQKSSVYPPLTTSKNDGSCHTHPQTSSFHRHHYVNKYHYVKLPSPPQRLTDSACATCVKPRGLCPSLPPDRPLDRSLFCQTLLSFSAIKMPDRLERGPALLLNDSLTLAAGQERSMALTPSDSRHHAQ